MDDENKKIENEENEIKKECETEKDAALQNNLEDEKSDAQSEKISEAEKTPEDEKIDHPKNPHAPHKKNKTMTIAIIVCLASALGGCSIGFGFGVANSLLNKILNHTSSSESHSSFLSEATPTPIFTPEQKFYDDQNDTQNNNDTVAIINQVSKAVVALNTISTGLSDEFFGLPITQSGSGSGVIFHEDDRNIYIVTNYHVVSGAESVKVTIENNKQVSAKLVGKNFASDIAVISVDKQQLKDSGIENITFASFGDSDNVRIGENIIAIGNALGEGSTVTSGIISAKDKKINVDGKDLSMIQIDASINPGNSGGALIDQSGEVIGLTTAKYAKFTVEGMAFCIPSNDVKNVIEDLMSKKDRPFLGITGINLTQELAESYGLPNAGVFINSIVKGSNAEKAGLQNSDIITMFNGKTVYSTSQLYNFIAECKIGEQVELHVIRNGDQQLNVKVILEEARENHF